ncbi:MAG: 50S ribosomal protein L33 [Erysipelotrichaceae bacterium]|nr:50S ribosomal protein L33 [Erysipelotrichaceae bacterium]
MADKSNKVILTCTQCLSRNYSTTKNKKTGTGRLELMKFCKKCGSHTLHKETK